MLIVLVVLVTTFGVIVTEKLRAELASVSACCVLLFARILTPSEVFPLFASEAVITVGAMFVLSAALERTGVISSAARALQALPLRTEWLVLCLVLPPVLAVSAFANNTPVVAVFLPIMLAFARERNLAPSKLLIPLSFASILGGSCTLIGTSTNLVASAVGERLGIAPIGMFELAPVGLLLAAFGLAYLLVFAPRLLPRRDDDSPSWSSGAKRQYLTEIFVPAGSSLIGVSAPVALKRKLPRGSVVSIIRSDRVLAMEPARVTLTAGDRLRIHADAAEIADLKELSSLNLQSHRHPDLQLGMTEETRLVECVVGPQSIYRGRTLAETDLGHHLGIAVHALHRAEEALHDRFDSIALHTGDVLLIEAGEKQLASISAAGQLLPLAGSKPQTPAAQTLDRRSPDGRGSAGVGSAGSACLRRSLGGGSPRHRLWVHGC